MSDEQTIGFIEPASLIKLQISGAFLDRVSFHLFNELRKYPPEEFKQVLDRIMKGEPSLSPEEDLLHVLSAIIGSARGNAKEQGLITQKSVEGLTEEVDKIISKMPPYKPRG